jgi:hypothetical protein
VSTPGHINVHDGADGVIAEANTLMSDLAALGLLEDAEVLGRGEDDARVVCSTCELRRLGYGGLADRLEFALAGPHSQEGEMP